MSRLDNNAVCMVVYNSYPSDPRVKRAAEHLSSLGYKVLIIASKEKNLKSNDEFNGVKILRIGLKKISGVSFNNVLSMGIFIFLAAIAIIKVHHKYSPKFYHIHSLPDFLVFTAFLPKLYGAKIILDLHESFPEITLARFNRFKNLTYELAVILEKISCKFSDKIIVVNEVIKDLVIKRGEKAERIEVIMNSPVNKLQNSQNKIIINNEVLEIYDRKENLFIYAGGINAERDLFTLVKAVKILKDKKNFKLNVLLFTHTETEYIFEIKKLIHDLNLEGIIKFCGKLTPEQVMANMQYSGIGIVSYVKSPLTEVALPNKVFEYMSIGLPIVAADLRTLRTILAENVYYYEPENTADLAEKIYLAFNDEKKLLKRNNLMESYKNYEWDVMGNRLEAIYQTLRH